jgi:glycosyltransferase involved in cell wall biosynthesis
MKESATPGNKLRVWQIVESYPPRYGGGATVVMRDICHALASIGHEVRVLCMDSTPDPPFSLRSDRDGQVQVDRLNLPYFMDTDPEGWQLGLTKWRKHERRVSAFIDDQLEQWRPDVVHYNTTRPFGEAGPLRIHRHGVPIVTTLHEAWFVCARLMLLRSPLAEPCSGPGPLKCNECMYSHYDGTHAKAALKMPWRLAKLRFYPAYRLWRRRSARRVLGAAIGYSNFMVRVHQPHLKGEASYVPVGVNLEGLPTAMPDRPRSPFRFGFLAGGQPTKGVWDVLEAAASLKRVGMDFELHVWGPQQEVVREEAAARDLDDRVLLRGMYDQNGRWAVYNEIDLVIVATTVCEPSTRIPPEAAAAGVPSIASNIGGNPEALEDEVSGLLYGFMDAADLERQMRRILEEPGLYQKLIDGLSPPVDTRTIGAEVEAIYRTALANSGREQAANGKKPSLAR